MTNHITLRDGRTLVFNTYGDPDGTPVIFSHGFSDSHVIRQPDDNLTASLGVRWIAADQPGVGGSSPKKDRRMVDWGADMEDLADHLGLDTFNVAGHSGGGPHALAVAFHMPERVRKVALASPVAPFDEPGVTKMLVLKDLKTIAKLRHLTLLIRWAERMGAKDALKDIPSYVESVVDQMPNEAKTILRNPERKALFEENFRLGFQQQEEGVFEMTMALWDWGFSPKEIQQPVEMFYGTADDIISPEMPRHLCSELPHCTAHEWAGAGHYGFVDRERWTEFVGAVASFS
ncbi:alpha/beta hydrolase [Ruegeria sp. R14_0]|uniref:alpha/beta fold hydrolase n=1 Tax=Ruegeria sp. R14_0 TaxID=2821100 RepID=UPI001ADC6FFC|nr:alpha/beta hydrolase [Ruegeria sp. R14_0]